MRGFAFPPASDTGDWHAPFYVAANDTFITWHPPDDEILIGISPEAITWSDYGSHHRTYPPGRTASHAPYFRTSSNDGSGYVTLINPGLIDILIPASIMRGFGPGELNVGVRYARASDSRTSTLFLGRLPIIHGVV